MNVRYYKNCLRTGLHWETVYSPFPFPVHSLPENGQLLKQQQCLAEIHSPEDITRETDGQTDNSITACRHMRTQTNPTKIVH